MRQENKGYHCWITNITKTKIVIGDLGITLNPRVTLDILDYRHSNLSIEQVAKSINEGSLSRRKAQNKIIIRQSAPPIEPIRRFDISKVSFPFKNSIGIKAEEKKYQEIEQDFEADEEFAMQNMESAIEERKPNS